MKSFAAPEVPIRISRPDVPKNCLTAGHAVLRSVTVCDLEGDVQRVVDGADYLGQRLFDCGDQGGERRHHLGSRVQRLDWLR